MVLLFGIKGEAFAGGPYALLPAVNDVWERALEVLVEKHPVPEGTNGAPRTSENL